MKTEPVNALQKLESATRMLAEIANRDAALNAETTAKYEDAVRLMREAARSPNHPHFAYVHDELFYLERVVQLAAGANKLSNEIQRKSTHVYIDVIAGHN